MKRGKIEWGRVLRRGAALFMATLAVWVLVITAGAGAAEVLKNLGESAPLVVSLLRAELGEEGQPEGPGAGLDGWGRLVVGQSALLRGSGAAVAAQLDGGAEKPSATRPPQETTTPREELEDPQKLPAVTAAPGDIVPRTLIPSGPDGYTTADGVYIFNRTDLPLDAAALAAAPVQLALGDASAPQVLIMHTHATEAYTPDGTDVYTKTDNSRTLNNEQNMVRIGNEMKAVFESMGLAVLHDETPYDYPAYKGAYSRSGAGVAEYLKKYPSIKIVLDVHRDALIGADGTVYKTMTTLDDAKVAQVELVLGSPKGGDHPGWQQNLTLAIKLQKSMNTLYPTLARPISVSPSVYNQNLTAGSILVEVGSHGNTLQEAIAGGRLFARAAGQVLVGLAGS